MATLSPHDIVSAKALDGYKVDVEFDTGEKAVEAANRADCFAKCKAQGIVPIGFSDGNNASAASKKRSRNNSSKGGNLSRFVIFAIILVLAGGIAYFFMNGKTAEAPMKIEFDPKKGR